MCRPRLKRLLALRLAPLGIGVFGARPGIIRTPMTEGVAERYDRGIAHGLAPLARRGTPEDRANLVGTLATGRLGFAAGRILHADGALSVPRP